MKKKKRFYNNKKRNSKWTEEEKGRKISFADKYIEAGSGHDKFDRRRPKEKKPFWSREKLLKLSKNAVLLVLCLVIVGIGYTAMDVFMERSSMPISDKSEEEKTGIRDVVLSFKSREVKTLSLDGAVMLSAVIDDTVEGAYSSLTFDLKRNDGTVGYSSSLATVDTYGAVSSPASQLEKSVAMLLENDILPIGRISCYKDNIMPKADPKTAVKAGSKLYKDSEGNTYLNPDSSAVYDYIKGIVEEVRGMGVTVFILDNCTLPEEISAQYSDGFDILCNKLYNDFGESVKFIEAVNVNITSDTAENISKQADEMLARKPGSSKTFYITAKSKNKVKQILDDREIKSYIIAE